MVFGICRVGPLKIVKRMPAYRQDLVENSLTWYSESEKPRLGEFERPESAANLVFDFTSCSRSASPIGASLFWWFNDSLKCKVCQLSAGILVIGDTKCSW